VRAVVQRVREASVTVDDETVGKIGAGVLALVAVTHDDTNDHARKLAEKIWHLRMFQDGSGMMNRSAAELEAEVLVVSQFTLYGDTSRGRRPSWTAAARAEQAEALVEEVAESLASGGARVQRGRFGAHMSVALVNDGPVTLIVDV
jgi:D-aminoacyl-tRNA deacylase